MRRVLLTAAVAGCGFISNAGVAQPINPWCLKAAMGRGWTVDLCYFRTFERCNQERFNYGGTSFCIVNPEYYFRYGEPDQRPRKTGRAAGR
jgi:hypothetical protein